MTTIVFWHWFVLGALLMALEIVLPGAIVLWFGVGAFVAGMAMWLVPSLSVSAQLLIFALFSIASLILWRQTPWYKAQTTPSDTPGLNDRVNKHIGQVYMLKTPIESGRGMVEVDGTLWQVQGADLPAGALVKVLNTDGAIFNVQPVN